jgi:hypothetical protein
MSILQYLKKELISESIRPHLPKGIKYGSRVINPGTVQAFKNKKVYSFNRKKGGKGGALYYELAPNRPDIVLKDMVKILHPDLLKNYKPYFFEQLK